METCTVIVHCRMRWNDDVFRTSRRRQSNRWNRWEQRRRPWALRKAGGYLREPEDQERKRRATIAPQVPSSGARRYRSTARTGPTSEHSTLVYSEPSELHFSPPQRPADRHSKLRVGTRYVPLLFSLNAGASVRFLKAQRSDRKIRNERSAERQPLHPSASRRLEEILVEMFQNNGSIASIFR